MNRAKVTGVGACALALLLPACMGYRVSPVDVQAPLRAQVPPLPSPLTYDAAVRYAVLHNPELVALRLRAEANAPPSREPVELGPAVDEDGRVSAGLAVEAISLLGLGEARAQRVLAQARRNEAVAAHHERAREIAVQLAEVFVTERALAGLTAPEHEVDVEAFVKAGLESSSAEAATAATRAEWSAEMAGRAAARARNRSSLARLLGLASEASAPLQPEAESWPLMPDPAPTAIVAARADLQRLVAAFEVADAELRRAVAAQYPGLVLQPEIAFEPTTLFGAVRLRIPVGARAEVCAAQHAREAARKEVEAGVVAALDEARRARASHEEAQAVWQAAQVRLDASGRLLTSTRARIEAGSASIIEAVFAADAVVTASRDSREAGVAVALTRVRAAAAAGWPSSSP